MKRLYIITGAKGHLAGTIIKQLKSTDCRIRGLILPGEEGTDDEIITYHKGDVTSADSLDAVFSHTGGYEVIVIHAAGIISISGGITPLLYNVNVMGTSNVIEKCLRYNVRRLIYVSSVHAIPEKGRRTAIKEVTAFSGDAVNGAYAKTKAEATQTVLDAVKRGLDAVIVHPSGILGPYDTGNNHIISLIKSYITGKLPAGVTGGYDFVDVRDVAEGCIAAADKGKSGECYILSNRYFTVKELLEYMRSAANGKKKICVPLKLAKIMAPVFEAFAKITKKRPLFTKYALQTLESNGHFSHDKATKVLGYNPRDMGTTIADTIKWLRGNLAVPVPM